MILVDTNVIIDFWKNPTDSSRRVFENEEVFVCGVVKAELVHGAVDENSYVKIKKALDCFPEIVISSEFWDDLSANLFRLKRKGLTVPFQDAMIATIAISNSLRLWTLDKHFSVIKSVLKDLTLFRLD